MAITTANTTLMYKATSEGSYAKLVDIIDYPDLGASPSKLDTTDLSATRFKTNILGLMEAPDFTFSANYDKTILGTIDGLLGDHLYFQIQFGTAGADGTFTWEGTVQAFVTGGGVDEVRKMSIVCSAETEVVVA